jgi:predicted hydrocarbon binding protein
VDELMNERKSLQESMNFLGALASGIEDAIGRPANSMAYVAGKRLGKKLSRNAEKTEDIEMALDEVRKVLEANSCLWQFDTVMPEGRKSLIETTEDGDEVLLVFQDCMIRQSLFSFGHHQKGSLCNMMYGFFSGALENITGCRSQLKILHAGENACLKKLVLER